MITLLLISCFIVFAHASENSIHNLEELIQKKAGKRMVFADENLFALKFSPMPKGDFISSLAVLSRLTPLRIEKQGEHLRILQPTFHTKMERVRFKADLLFPYSDKLIWKLSQMKGFFLREKVEFKRSGRWILTHFEGVPQFYLNQFYEDFHLFVKYLHPEQECRLLTQEKDWIRFQRDLLFDDYQGFLPDQFSASVNPAFYRSRRLGILSDVVPLKSELE